MPRKFFGRVRDAWLILGPGVITGAADDDPSGIATYSIAGARFGTALLWMAPVTWPLMAAVQSMCARIGMVTGGGLLSALREKFPRPLLMATCGALLLANTLNIGADLSAMADAVGSLIGVSPNVCVLVIGGLLVWATIGLRYGTIAGTLKWLALVLGAYVITAIKLGPPWGSVLHDTFLPPLPRGADLWATVVAILGTTISPYLFFWQASQEVEEERAKGRHTKDERRGATAREIVRRKVDVGVGTFVSNGAMYFIILTTALTLHRHGVTQLATSRDVAEALRPLAGNASALLFAIGIVGTGALAIPVLAGSAGYACAELFDWREGIDETLRGAPAFYAVVGLSVAAGVVLQFAGAQPIRVLYISAIVNGALAPFLLAGILAVASDGTLMRGQPSSLLGRITVGATMVLMFGATAGIFMSK